MYIAKIKTAVIVILLTISLVGIFGAKQVSANFANGCQGNTTQCVCPASPTGGQDPNCGQDPAYNTNGSLDCNGDGKPDANCTIITKYLNPLIRVMSAFAGIAIVIGIIISGIQYSSAGADPQKITTAKRHLRNSIIALLFYLFMYAILKFLIPGQGIV